MITSLTFLERQGTIHALVAHDDGLITAVTFKPAADGPRTYICTHCQVTLISRATWAQILDSYDICECLHAAGDVIFGTPPEPAPEPPDPPADIPSLSQQMWEMVAQRFEQLRHPTPNENGEGQTQ